MLENLGGCKGFTLGLGNKTHTEQRVLPMESSEDQSTLSQKNLDVNASSSAPNPSRAPWGGLTTEAGSAYVTSVHGKRSLRAGQPGMCETQR